MKRSRVCMLAFFTAVVVMDFGFGRTGVAQSVDDVEPVPISGASGQSVRTNVPWAWWVWTAPATGAVTFDTQGSSFPAVVIILDGPTEVASNFDLATLTLADEASFTAQSGRVYDVVASRFDGSLAPGTIVLNWQEGAGDGGGDVGGGLGGADNFASSTAISGASGHAVGNNIGAGREAGEPLHAAGTGGASVWWTWTAPASGDVTFDTHGSNFDTLLAVYTGSSLNGLTLVGWNDDTLTSLQSVVEFAAQGGRAYHIVVDGFAGSMGEIMLSWQQGSPSTPDVSFSSPTRSETVIVDGVSVEAAENEVLVFLEEDISRDELADTEEEIATQGGTVKTLNFALRTIQVGITDDIAEQDFIAAMSGREGIAGSDVNELISPDREFVTTNEEGFRLWLGKNDWVGAGVPAPSPVSFSGDYWIEQVGLWQAWQVLSDPEVTLDPNTIGIVDTGIPSTQNVLDSTRVRRYSPEGRSIAGDDSPSISHGQNVTGYAAAYRNTFGAQRRGVDPHSDVVFVDVAGVDGRAYSTDLLQGIKTAIDRGAKVVNFSWGDTSQCGDARSARIPSRQRFRTRFSGAVHYARQRDALVVFSAGNNCEKHDDQLLRERDDPNADSWRSHALIVGASTASRKDACFSRMGGVVNVMAPGEQVGYGAGAANGTSYAAPMVTGAAGLVRAIEATLSAEETRSIILRSARRTVTFNSNATNISQCTTSRRSVNMPGTAVEPSGLLHVGAAVESALVADGVSLEVADSVALRRGQRDQVRLTIDVPLSGVGAIDVAFLIDQSGSYSDDIDTLQARARDIVNSLASQDFDVQFGVAGFADFPQGSYGARDDVPYSLYQGISFDVDAVIAAIDRLDQPLMNGNDYPESQFEAVYRTVTEIGWRDGALRVLLLATDADFHDSDVEPAYPGKGRRAVLDILEEEDVIVIGLQSGGDASAQARLQELATLTDGSVWPLDAASSQIVSAITDGIEEAVSELDVTLDVLAGESWVTGITPRVHEGVAGGDSVSFTVALEGQRRTSVEGLDYNVYLWARGDGAALLSRLRIPIRVPAE